MELGLKLQYTGTDTDKCQMPSRPLVCLGCLFYNLSLGHSTLFFVPASRSLRSSASGPSFHLKGFEVS